MSWRLLFQTMGPLLAVGVLALVAGLVGASQLQMLRQRGTRIVSENVASIRAAESMEATTTEVRYRLKRYLSNGNRRHIDEIQSLLPELTRQLHLDVRRSAMIDPERRIYHTMIGGLEELKEELLTLEETIDEGKISHATEIARLISDDLIPQRLVAPLQRYVQQNEQQLARDSARNDLTADRMAIGLLILGCLGGLAGLISGYAIARRVNRTLIQLSLPVRAAAGVLHQVSRPISISASEDFRGLESTMHEVESRVRSVVDRLQVREREILRTERLAAMGQLAAGLGHELRNPLTSIKAILQLADRPTSLTERDLTILKQEMSRLEHGLQSFLDFARPAKPIKRQTDLRPVFLQTLELVARRAESKQVRLVHDIPRDCLWGLADVAQIRQITLNLLLNAIESVSVGGVVHVTCRRITTNHGRAKPERMTQCDPGSSDVDKDREGRGLHALNGSSVWCELRVRDDGPGLPRDLGQSIFEPFVSTKDSGLGLGLSISKRIVALHGGILTAGNIRRNPSSTASDDNQQDARRDSIRLEQNNASDLVSQNLQANDQLVGAEFLVRLPLMTRDQQAYQRIACST